MKNNIYADFAIKNAPRILSQIDRDPDSPTYGCCDRNFWHYKIRDFPSAILQQAGLGLAILYSNDFEGNIYFRDDMIKNISIATLVYWTKIQHRDGSFDEYWPFEHGFPPTAFSLYSSSEICRIFGIKDKKILSSILKASKYLLKNSEKAALNQEIAAACAVFSAAKTLNSKNLRLAAERKMHSVIKKQKNEGWFSEYGGADMGYLSVSLNYLCEYYTLSKDGHAKKSASCIVDFIKYFVHPDGSFGGDYGSRNTEYFLPAGFEIASQFNSSAGAAVEKLMEYAEKNFSIDDRYLCHYVFYSFARAASVFRRGNHSKLPYETEFSKHFSNAGIFINSTKYYYLVTALSKGGVSVIFDKKKKKRVLNDCGYRAFSGKKILVTNWLNSDYHLKNEKSSIIINSNFYSARFHTPTPIQHLMLRASSFLIGRRLIPIMKRIFIFHYSKSRAKIERKIRLMENEIIIEDAIKSTKKLDIIKSSYSLSLRFCPSSRYFQNSFIGSEGECFLRKNISTTENKKRIRFR